MKSWFLLAALLCAFSTGLAACGLEITPSTVDARAPNVGGGGGGGGGS